MISQYDRFILAYEAMTKELGELENGEVNEIIYCRNIYEYADAPSGDYSFCIIKYPTPTRRMQLGLLPLKSESLLTPWRHARLYFHPNRTIVVTHSIIWNMSRHKKNRRSDTVKTVLDVTQDYDGYMHSEVVKKFIRRTNLKTFLKIGDINEWEDKDSVF